MWGGAGGVRLDVGLISISGMGSPCGEIQAYSSTSYPQEKPFSYLIHILEIPNTSAHMWGHGFIAISRSLASSPQ